MASIDAMVPRSKGGDYSNKNARLVDSGCNFVKLAFSAEEAMVLIGRLGAERALDVDERGMLCPPTRSQINVDFMSTAVVEAWAKKMIRCTTRRHPVEMTTDDRVQLVKGYMVTESDYRDPSGIKLPLAAASLDRIDPDEGYRKDNVRCLTEGETRMDIHH